MKFWTSEYTFSHSWDKVTQAAWRKYPNPMNPSVVGIDVVERKVEGGVLSTHRLIGSQWGIPLWIEAIIGSPSVMYANEKSEVNPREKIMTLKTRNITFCKHIAVDETLKYTPHPKDPEKTLLKQEAVITVEGVPLSSYVEGLLASTISTNASKGRLAMEWVLKKINDELKELSHTVEKNKGEFINSTIKSIDGITVTAKKSMDETLNTAKKSLEDWVKEPVSVSPVIPPFPDL